MFKSNGMEKHAVLIYDDHPIVCESLKIILSRIKSVDNIVCTSNYKQAISIISSHEFDLLILDVNLDSADGFQFFRRAKSHGYSGKTVFFSCNSQDYCSKVAYELGANGYIDKSEGQDVIINALETVLSGYNFFKSNQRDISSKVPKLSNREVMVLNYLLQGKSNNDVSHILGLSPKTVSTYKRRILDKYGVSSVIELIEVSKREAITGD
ncbi:response regulator transcription factor [Vibrio sp. Hep-1b-8]|uniref:response regulator transcription factor n=1 Tax=unclassified Vibrio TaxID=2614977 RepID=UPI0011104DA5|nr:response regulator transcription factor [Vibrio sp. Hep-1b-8]TMX33239.1 DNA-binding response regulator [Vibrio sp. Hep-1b-8]